MHNYMDLSVCFVLKNLNNFLISLFQSILSSVGQQNEQQALGEDYEEIHSQTINSSKDKVDIVTM